MTIGSGSWWAHPWPKASHGWGTRLVLVMLAGSMLQGAVGFTQQAEVTATEQTPDQKAKAQVVFDFERPGLAVPKFTMTVNEDGTGRYVADQIFPVQGTEAPGTQHIDRAISLSAAGTAQMFANARALDRFHAPCASPMKNIADTGTKTLRYSGTGGEGTCTYNYSQDKRVVALTDMFLAIAQTLDMGRKLDFEHRFDRLGLDATMASLADEAEAGRAMELGTIASTLKSIARDSDVLERVRSLAARLLKQAQPDA